MSQAKILSAVRAISEEKAVTPLEVEARLNRANAMIYLLSAALMWCETRLPNFVFSPSAVRAVKRIIISPRQPARCSRSTLK